MKYSANNQEAVATSFLLVPVPFDGITNCRHALISSTSELLLLSEDLQTVESESEACRWGGTVRALPRKSWMFDGVRHLRKRVTSKRESNEKPDGWDHVVAQSALQL